MPSPSATLALLPSPLLGTSVWAPVEPVSVATAIADMPAALGVEPGQRRAEA